MLQCATALCTPAATSDAAVWVPWLRRRCGVLTGDVLDTIAGWPAEKQHAANQAIKEVEEEVQKSLHLVQTLNVVSTKVILSGLAGGLAVHLPAVPAADVRHLPCTAVSGFQSWPLQYDLTNWAQAGAQS